MAGAPIKDGGAIQIEMTSPDGVTLATQGKYCPENIEVTPVLQYVSGVNPISDDAEVAVLPGEGYAGLARVKIAAVPNGVEGTPTATKTVSGNTATITPRVTNQRGYIPGSAKEGDPITVTASELTSGSKAITPSVAAQNVDVTNYKTAAVAAIQTEQKTATANGDVTPSSGKYLTKVTVNIPDPTLTGDAAPSDVLAGKTFYKDNPRSKITGTIPTYSGDSTGGADAAADCKRWTVTVAEAITAGEAILRDDWLDAHKEDGNLVLVFRREGAFSDQGTELVQLMSGNTASGSFYGTGIRYSGSSKTFITFSVLRNLTTIIPSGSGDFGLKYINGALRPYETALRTGTYTIMALLA